MMKTRMGSEPLYAALLARSSQKRSDDDETLKQSLPFDGKQPTSAMGNNISSELMSIPSVTEVRACWELCRLHNNIGFWVVYIPTSMCLSSIT